MARQEPLENLQKLLEQVRQDNLKLQERVEKADKTVEERTIRVKVIHAPSLSMYRANNWYRSCRNLSRKKYVRKLRRTRQRHGFW